MKKKKKKKKTYAPAFTGREVEEVTPLGRSRRQPLPFLQQIKATIYRPISSFDASAIVRAMDAKGPTHSRS